jgi:hypothetical protein
MRLRLKRLVAVMLVLGSGVGAHGAQLPTGNSEGKNQKDLAGPYVVTNNDMLTAKGGQKIGEVRTFLWEHWSGHKLGHLELTLFSKEGVATNTTFEIEPDEHGVWSLRVTIDRPTLKGTSAGHSEYRSYSVRRTVPRNDRSSPLVSIPETEKRTGDAYRLAFFDEKDEKVGGI